MLSVRAIYDGKKLKFLEKVKVYAPQEVIVTFIDEDTAELFPWEMCEINQKGKAFNFLEDEREDVYNDKDLKVRYHE